MSNEAQTGNNVVSGDFLRVLMALKSNIMKDMNVADVVQVKSQNADGTWSCRSITDDAALTSYAMLNVDVQVNDVAVVLFTNSDFRQNLKSLIADRPLKTELSSDHNKSASILLGVIYRPSSDESNT